MVQTELISLDMLPLQKCAQRWHAEGGNRRRVWEWRVKESMQRWQKIVKEAMQSVGTSCQSAPRLAPAEPPEPAPLLVHLLQAHAAPICAQCTCYTCAYDVDILHWTIYSVKLLLMLLKVCRADTWYMQAHVCHVYSKQYTLCHVCPADIKCRMQHSYCYIVHTRASSECSTATATYITYTCWHRRTLLKYAALLLQAYVRHQLSSEISLLCVVSCLIYTLLDTDVDIWC